MTNAAIDRLTALDRLMLEASRRWPQDIGALAILDGTRGEPVEDTTVRTYVPVSLRPRGSGPQQGNLIAQMAVPLRMRQSDANGELHRIASQTALRKAR